MYVVIWTYCAQNKTYLIDDINTKYLESQNKTHKNFNIKVFFELILKFKINAQIIKHNVMLIQKS